MSDENLQTDLSISAEIKLYYDLFIPEKIISPAPLLIAVHGYGAHKRHMMREARLVAPENFVIASVQAPHPHYRPSNGTYKIGFGWLSDFKPEEAVALHHKFLNDVVAELMNKNQIDAKQIFLYGFSQACALNFRYVFSNPRALKGVIGVCGGIPSDLETNESYSRFEGEVFYLYDDNDEFYPLEKFRDFEKRLKKFAPNLRAKCFQAKHEITDEMRDDIKEFLQQEI